LQLGEAAGNDLLWFIAEGTAGKVGAQFFQCLVEHIALAFGADVAFLAEVIPDDRDRARRLACWEGGRQIEPREYRLAGTPCAGFRVADVVSYTQGVRQRFPEDKLVVDLDLDSYLAVALRGSDGAHLGQLGVLARGPLAPDSGGSPRSGSSPPARRQRSSAGGKCEREASHRALADEQAALRRVAVLVAAGAPEPRSLRRRAG
jgi:hypothetical protein